MVHRDSSITNFSDLSTIDHKSEIMDAIVEVR